MYITFRRHAGWNGGFCFFFLTLVYCNLAVHKMNRTGLKEWFRLCVNSIADWAWFKWQILQHLWPLGDMQDMNVNVFWMLSLFSNKYKLICKFNQFSVNISQLTFTEKYAFKTKEVPRHSTEQCSYNKDPCLPSTVFWMSAWQGFLLPGINCELQWKIKFLIKISFSESPACYNWNAKK